MQLWWGSYALPVNGADVTTQVTAVAYSAAGNPIRYGQTVAVVAWLDGEGQAALAAKEAALRAALARPHQDLLWRLDSGALSPVSMADVGSLSGNRVVTGPTFQNEARDGEYVTQRTARFEVYAEYGVANSQAAVTRWSELVTVTGDGGPDRRWRFPLNARPVRVVVSPFSLVTAVQSGEGFGHLVRPNPPPPLFPAYLVRNRSSTGRIAPTPVGRGSVNPGTRWSYVFEADGPLVGNPTPAPQD